MRVVGARAGESGIGLSSSSVSRGGLNISSGRRSTLARQYSTSYETGSDAPSQPLSQRSSWSIVSYNKDGRGVLTLISLAIADSHVSL